MKDATAQQIKEEISRLGHTGSKQRSSSNIDGNTVTSKKSSTAKSTPEAHPTPKPKSEESSTTTVVKKSSSDTASTTSGHTSGSTKTKSSRRRKKQAEEEIQLRDDEDSPWDQSDDESDEQLSLDQFIPPYDIYIYYGYYNGESNYRCSARTRLTARIPRLVLIEEHCFGTKNIDEYELPGNLILLIYTRVIFID